MQRMAGLDHCTVGRRETDHAQVDADHRGRLKRFFHLAVGLDGDEPLAAIAGNRDVRGRAPNDTAIAITHPTQLRQTGDCSAVRSGIVPDRDSGNSLPRGAFS